MIMIMVSILMPRMLVVVVTTRFVIMAFLISRMDVCEAMNMLVHVFVKMFMLNLPMLMPVHMQVMM